MPSVKHSVKLSEPLYAALRSTLGKGEDTLYTLVGEICWEYLGRRGIYLSDFTKANGEVPGRVKPTSFPPPYYPDDEPDEEPKEKSPSEYSLSPGAQNLLCIFRKVRIRPTEVYSKPVVVDKENMYSAISYYARKVNKGRGQLNYLTGKQAFHMEVYDENKDEEGTSGWLTPDEANYVREIVSYLDKGGQF